MMFERDMQSVGKYPAITTEFINKHVHPSQAAKLCRADWSGKDESSVETVHPEVIKLLHAYVDATCAMRAQAALAPMVEFDDCTASPTGKHSESWFANGDCSYCNDGAQPDAPLFYASAAPKVSPVAQGDALDAARYRWLRDPASNVALVLDKRTGYVPSDEHFPGVGGYHTYEYRAGEELDAAIDAARAQVKEGGAA